MTEKYNFNTLNDAALKFFESKFYDKAIDIYIFMGDGDPSLDGGFIAYWLGRCYQSLGSLQVAKYWYGRAVEENPQITLYVEARQNLSEITPIKEIVSLGIEDPFIK